MHIAKLNQVQGAVIVKRHKTCLCLLATMTVDTGIVLLNAQSPTSNRELLDLALIGQAVVPAGAGVEEPVV